MNIIVSVFHVYNLVYVNKQRNSATAATTIAEANYIVARVCLEN